jgi:hypothetical protein
VNSENRYSTTIIDLEMMHILLVLGLTSVVGLLIQRPGNGDVTSW